MSAPVNIKLNADVAYRRSSLIDPRTSEPLFFYVGKTLSVAFTCLNKGVVADLSDLTSAHVAIKAVGASSDDDPLAEVNILPAAVDTSLTQSEFDDSGMVHATAVFASAATALTTGKKQIIVYTLHTGGEVVTWLSGIIEAVEDGGGLAGTAPDAANQYYTAGQTDARYAPMSASIGSMDPAKYGGEITTLAKDLVDPETSAGIWYYVNGVSGNMTGAFFPTDPVEDGGFVISDGTEYLVRGKQPFSIPTDYIQTAMIADGMVSEEKLSVAVQAMLMRLGIKATTTNSLALQQGKKWSSTPLKAKTGDLVVASSDNKGVLDKSKWKIFLITDDNQTYISNQNPSLAGYVDLSPSILASDAVDTLNVKDLAITEQKLSSSVQDKLAAATAAYAYQGTWDAATGAPTPTVANQAWLIINEGTFGSVDWNYGDTAVWSGTAWGRIPYEYENYVYDGGNLGDPIDIGPTIDGGTLE